MSNPQYENNTEHPDDHLPTEEDGCDNEPADEPGWKAGIQRSNNGFIAIIN